MSTYFFLSLECSSWKNKEILQKRANSRISPFYLNFLVSTSAQGPTQKRSQVEFLQFVCPSPHKAAVLPSAIVAKNMSIFHSHELLSKVLDQILMVASVLKTPIIIRVALSCRQALSERALWLLLIVFEANTPKSQQYPVLANRPANRFLFRLVCRNDS